MGGRSQYTPRTTMKLLIILAIVATAAYAAVDESEFTEKSDPETVLLEMDAHQTVKTMLKKGATEADCKDLADTSCKEVERERCTNQRLLNKLKTGSKCPGLGQRQVRITMKHYTITRKKWQTSVTTLKTTRRTTVHFSSRRYSSITHGKCGWIFSSRTYQHVKRKVNHAVRMERILRGKTVEAAAHSRIPECHHHHGPPGDHSGSLSSHLRQPTGSCTWLHWIHRTLQILRKLRLSSDKLPETQKSQDE